MKKEGHLTGASTAYGTSTASNNAVTSASENSDNGNGTEHAVGIMTQEHISISIPPTSTNSSTEDDFISLSEHGSDSRAQLPLLHRAIPVMRLITQLYNTRVRGTKKEKEDAMPAPIHCNHNIPSRVLQLLHPPNRISKVRLHC
ncbi:hypothetical protein Pelo_6831 [Pelomyxa schiedti]|nr:hypothetical protein Pelo_6831 [Pelomyxa schiedti]